MMSFTRKTNVIDTIMPALTTGSIELSASPHTQRRPHARLMAICLTDIDGGTTSSTGALWSFIMS